MASICVFPQKTKVFTNQTLSALEMNFLSTLLQFGIIDTSWHWGTHLSLIFTILCLSWPCFQFTDMSTSAPEELQIYIFHWCLKPLRSENFFYHANTFLVSKSLLPKFPSFIYFLYKISSVLLIYISIYSNDSYILEYW